MIKGEKAFCIYCLGPLSSREEIDLQYHIYCRKELERFDPESTDFEPFNLKDLEKFKKKWQIRRIFFYIALIFNFSLYVVLFINFLPVIAFSLFNFFVFTIGFILITAIIILAVNRTELLINFSKVLLYLKPDYMYLSFKYSVALIGEIYVVNYPGFSIINGIYIIKFLDVIEDKESRKVKLPTFPFSTAFVNKLYSILFARMVKKIQIRYNSTTVKTGKASIYCVRYNDIKDNYWRLNSLIFYMNRENLDFKPDFVKYPKWKLLVTFLAPWVALVLYEVVKIMIIT